MLNSYACGSQSFCISVSNFSRVQSLSSVYFWAEEIKWDQCVWSRFTLNKVSWVILFKQIRKELVCRLMSYICWCAGKCVTRASSEAAGVQLDSLVWDTRGERNWWTFPRVLASCRIEAWLWKCSKLIICCTSYVTFFFYYSTRVGKRSIFLDAKESDSVEWQSGGLTHIMFSVRVLPALPGWLTAAAPLYAWALSWCSLKLHLLMCCKLCEMAMKWRSHGFQCTELRHCLHGAPKIGQALLSDLPCTVT